MPKIYDIDAQAEAYETIRIKFRGTEYALGETTLQVLLAMEVVEGDTLSTKDLVTNLPMILQALCPAIKEALEKAPLRQAEEVALLKPVTAVMMGFSALSKSDGGEETEE